MGAISYKALVITVRTVEDHMRATKRNYIMHVHSPVLRARGRG